MSDILLMGDPIVTGTPVVDCGETLVDVRIGTDLEVGSLKAAESESYMFLRSGVLERLRTAQDALPSGYGLLVLEGHRPDNLQRHYFDTYRARLIRENPGLSETESFMLASRYVAPPEIAPHVSGAAIDLTVTDSNGDALDMGTAVNATPEDSEGACYFGATNITARARNNRALMAAALSEAGLINYPTEWWHWSYGDRYWAQVTGTPTAIYGPASTPHL